MSLRNRLVAGPAGGRPLLAGCAKPGAASWQPGQEQVLYLLPQRASRACTGKASVDKLLSEYTVNLSESCHRGRLVVWKAGCIVRTYRSIN